MNTLADDLPPDALFDLGPEHGPPPPDPLPGRAPIALEPVPAREPEPLRTRDLLGAIGGLVALGATAALGSSSGAAAARLVPSVLLVDLSALALTAPALIALHQYFRLAAEPEALASALGRALVHGGRIAGALSLVVLFFSATTELWLLLLVASLAAVGLFTTATAWTELRRAELAALERHSKVEASSTTLLPRFQLLVNGWIALAWVIALRVGVNVAQWVVEV
ncbi:hypothetical protein PPSIR1_13840 [Plesiocystis pacifica SIR-1]|uniref:Uncharacterized protein n=1 Tax=Plesiocystis pacifica SIR-1 TaxID=391625 RepID=A6G8V3_9BACT|nr:hypothetical protein [Plesiocystis pacifica]EDM77639.1 hypothetical protein PPSIR1_13840 [Plesiocystis pacifica SIR-1]